MGIEEWKELFTNIGSGIIGLILAVGQISILLNMKKDKIAKNKKDNENKYYGVAIKNENKFALEIQKQLEETRQCVNADRAQIIEFHNGTDFSTRKAYRLDSTYESVKYGNPSIKNLLKDYPTTMLPTFMSKMIDEKQYFVSDVEALHEKDMSTYTMKINTGVKAFYDMLLEKNGLPIGILAIQYSNPTELTSVDIANMEAKKIIIENLL